MSVVLGDTLVALDRDPSALAERAYPGNADWGVAVMAAGCVTQVPEQTLHRTPTESEPAHGDVRGKKNSGRRKRLKKCAEWLIPPTAPAVE
jgi:hypothetical protein